MKGQNNILVSVSGLTPQVITEALYFLSVKKKIRINEIYVITTQKGKKVLQGKANIPGTMNTTLKKEISELCKHYKIVEPKFDLSGKHIIAAKEESAELPDIRTDVHNQLFPNKIAEFIKQKTAKPENVLHCLITGGRKSMSVHLAGVLSLFGREKDKLYHILTSEKFEFKGFYPKTKAEIKSLELSEIPYVRLRSLISPSLSQKELSNKTYIDFVRYTQSRLSLVYENKYLLIDLPKRSLIFNDKSVTLEPLQLGLYCLIIQKYFAEKKPVKIQELISHQFGKELNDFLKEFIPLYHESDSPRNWRNKGLDDTAFRSKRSKINQKIKEFIDDLNLAENFMISSNKVYGETSYFIKAPEKTIKIIFESDIL